MFSALHITLPSFYVLDSFKQCTVRTQKRSSLVLVYAKFPAFFPLLEKLIEDIEDPLFQRDEAYFLTGEEEYDEKLRKFVRFAKIQRRLGDESDYDWRKYGRDPLSYFFPLKY